MISSIFVIGADNTLVEVSPSSFAKEFDFQKLIADHPDLLGPATGDDLLLVSQEFGIADEEDGSDRWRVDHLFLTSDGMPVLVEVKRASDSRNRREVVAQMLDYAAHAPKTLTAEIIAVRFGAAASKRDQNSEDLLQEFIGDRTIDEFWKLVEANLRAGRIRMVIVADKVGPELSRIVEFLNEQMRSAEMLAIELAYFEAKNGTRTLVPRVIGATSRAASAKSGIVGLQGGTGVNFRGRAKLDDVKQMCADRGDAVVIGFVGGLQKLKDTSLAALEAKHAYKWDDAIDGIGVKRSANWIPGTTFLDEVQSKST